MSGTKDNSDSNPKEEVLSLDIQPDFIPQPEQITIKYYEDPGDFKVIDNINTDYSSDDSDS